MLKLDDAYMSSCDAENVNFGTNVLNMTNVRKRANVRKQEKAISPADQLRAKYFTLPPRQRKVAREYFIKESGVSHKSFLAKLRGETSWPVLEWKVACQAICNDPNALVWEG